MAPVSLYRKHRPQRFGEIVGQEHVTTALRNAVCEDRVGHAYLFSGPRGTGKTTTARLLAKALNCLHLGDDGEPCGECENCVAVTESAFYDLVELDAASNNGVDAMRDLIQTVSLGLGSSSKRKVYVVDEVHMLSAAASNALLKTLEEPPAHVVFVLATTDPQKVLPTIRSRTQHFEFRLLTLDELRGHVVDVLAREGVEAEPDAVELIARRAAGSARDALSLLDQALALGAGRLDTEQVARVFADTPFERRVVILEAVATGDVAGALGGVADAVSGGVDPRQLADDLLRTLRDAFVVSTSHGRVPYEGPAEEADRVVALATEMGAAAVVRGIETLGEAMVDIRGPAAPDPRLTLEVAVVRLTRRDARGSLDALVERVERLEHRLDEVRGGAVGSPGAPAARPDAPTRSTGGASAGAATRPGSALGAHLPAPPAPTTEPATGSPGGGEAEVAEAPSAAVTDAAPSGDAAPLDLDDVVLAWEGALGDLPAPLRATAQEAQPVSVERAGADEVVVFGAPPVHLERLRTKFRAEADRIKAALQGRLGRTPKLKLVAHDFTSDRRPAAGAPTAARAAPDPEGEPPPDAAPPEEEIDLRDLVDADDAAAPVDSIERLVEDLGAQVVEERPRE